MGAARRFLFYRILRRPRPRDVTSESHSSLVWSHGAHDGCVGPRGRHSRQIMSSKQPLGKPSGRIWLAHAGARRSPTGHHFPAGSPHAPQGPTELQPEPPATRTPKSARAAPLADPAQALQPRAAPAAGLSASGGWRRRGGPHRGPPSYHADPAPEADALPAVEHRTQGTGGESPNVRADRSQPSRPPNGRPRGRHTTHRPP